MKLALGKFFTDLAEGGAAGAGVALAAFDLNSAPWKVVLAAVLIGFLNGAIAAARRYAISKITPA